MEADVEGLDLSENLLVDFNLDLTIDYQLVRNLVIDGNLIGDPRVGSDFGNGNPLPGVHLQHLHDEIPSVGAHEVWNLVRAGCIGEK